MSIGNRLGRRLLALSLIFSVALTSLSQPAYSTLAAQNPPTLSEVNDLAAALVAAAGEEDQERLLARKKDLVNNALLAALKAIADPLFKKGDYAQALRISQLAARIAERIGDRVGLGNVLIDLGRTHDRQGRYAQSLDCYQKGLAIFEEAGD